MEVRCRPITTFPPEFQARQRSSQFRAGWSDTLWTLESELEKLGARSCVIELALKESEIRLDGWPRAEARPTHPGVIISFDSKHGPLRYGTDAFPHWQENVRALALGLEKLRAIERYGIGKRGEQYKGWAALESGLATRGQELIDEHGGVKEALFATHPDHGGNAEDFQAVQAAR